MFAVACGPDQFEILGQTIIHGSPDNNSAHSAVVALTFSGYLCSGTLISSDVVLTAGHCGDGHQASEYQVRFGNDAGAPTATRTATELKVHPGYNGNTILNDIALLRLSSPAPAGIAPIPALPASLAINSNDIGQQDLLEWVGFGKDAAGNTGAKLTFTGELDWICTNNGGCLSPQGYPLQKNTICNNQSDGGTCNGDSGGPAFVKRSGQEYVAGVTSYGDQNCTAFGCSTKVDAFESFIRDFVGGTPGASCTADSDCESGFCEQGVCCKTECKDACESCALQGSLGTCAPAPNGAACLDGNLCNGSEVCQAGSCVAGTPLNCDDHNLCTADSCDATRGCLHPPVADGTACPDADQCNGTETCRAGVCSPATGPACDDKDACTTDSCDAVQGCRHIPAADGTACGGGACGQAACKAGQCFPSNATVCSDNDPCTLDTCDKNLTCAHPKAPDGAVCGPNSTCQTGICTITRDTTVEGVLACGAFPIGAGGWLPLGVCLLALRRRRRR